MRRFFYSTKYELSVIDDDILRELTHSESMKIKKQLRRLNALSFGKISHDLNREKPDIVFRGCNHEFDVFQFCQSVFVTGAKANFYQSDEIMPSSNEEFDLEMERMVNFINEKRNKQLSGFFSLDMIKDLPIEEKFLFLKFLVHNIGLSHYHRNSNVISTSTDFTIAKKFALARNSSNNKYVIISIFDNRQMNLSAWKLKDFLTEKGLNWYPDNNKEIMISDAISPAKIIAIIDINNDKVIFNNFFVEACKNDYFNILYDDIEVDQSNFHQLNRMYGNNGFLLILPDGSLIRHRY